MESPTLTETISAPILNGTDSFFPLMRGSRFVSKYASIPGKEPLTMYTKEQLKTDLKQMGLAPTDSIMIHSSCKSIGEVEGRADGILDALMEFFSEGLLMLPTHTWAQMGTDHSVFDPETEPACVGILPNLFRKRPGVIRSLHPTHSIAAYGRGTVHGICAADFVKGEENCTTPCMPGGCWDRLRTVHAKIILIGVTHARNTFIHAVEEILDVPERLTEQPVEFQIKMPDGSLKPIRMHRHYNRHTAHISEAFDKLMDAYFETGAAVRTTFGDANCILCDANRIFEVTKEVLSHEINCFIDREEIPREWWQGLSS